MLTNEDTPWPLNLPAVEITTDADRGECAGFFAMAFVERETANVMVVQSCESVRFIKDAPPVPRWLQHTIDKSRAVIRRFR